LFAVHSLKVRANPMRKHDFVSRAVAPKDEIAVVSKTSESGGNAGFVCFFKKAPVGRLLPEFEIIHACED
jgi:hypothetical protein